MDDEEDKAALQDFFYDAADEQPAPPPPNESKKPVSPTSDGSLISQLHESVRSRKRSLNAITRTLDAVGAKFHHPEDSASDPSTASSSLPSSVVKFEKPIIIKPEGHIDGVVSTVPPATPRHRHSTITPTTYVSVQHKLSEKNKQAFKGLSLALPPHIEKKTKAQLIKKRMGMPPKDATGKRLTVDGDHALLSPVAEKLSESEDSLSEKVKDIERTVNGENRPKISINGSKFSRKPSDVKFVPKNGGSRSPRGGEKNQPHVRGEGDRSPRRPEKDPHAKDPQTKIDDGASKKNEKDNSTNERDRTKKEKDDSKGGKEALEKGGKHNPAAEKDLNVDSKDPAKDPKDSTKSEAAPDRKVTRSESRLSLLSVTSEADPEKKGGIRGFFSRRRKESGATIVEVKEPVKDTAVPSVIDKDDPRIVEGLLLNEELTNAAAAAVDPSANQAPIQNGDEVAKSLESKLDLSSRLLKLSTKGEWMLVDNLIRYAKPSELNLSVVDEHGFTPLMLAAKDTKLNVVERLVELGANLKDATSDGRTVAHIAAMYAREDIVKILITKKADFKTPAGPSNQLPLHMACARPTATVAPVVGLLLRTAAHEDPSVNPRILPDGNGSLPLLLAVEAGNVQVARELLLTNAPEQVKWKRSDTGETALHLACKKRDLELAKVLVEYGASANAQNNDGQTPLHYVAAAGDEGLLKVMYTAKANPNIIDKEDKTALHIATEHGHTSMVETLIDKFKTSITARTKDGSTLMHLASEFGHPETALAFLKRGVPLMMPNKSGKLGLHCAAASGHIQVIKTLLQKGTNVDARTKENYTALHVAVESGKPLAVEALLGAGANVHIRGGKLGETALHLAAGYDGDAGELCAEMLLKSGAEVNVRLENGESALHIAARKGYPKMVKLLLADGADPTAVSKSGESALHVAARACHFEVLKLILDYVERTRRKEDATTLVNLPTMEGETAVHYAAEVTKNLAHYPNEDVDIMRSLLEYGGEVNVYTNLTMETALHYCARSGNEDVLVEIVKNIGPGAVQIALNKQSKNGWSPLLDACEKGHLATTRILLQHHARVDVFDEHGKTALHLAAENGHADVCDALLWHKAFVNSKTKLGVTPLHLAAMQGHQKVVSLLVTQHKASIDALSLDNRTPLHLASKHGQLAVCSILLNLGANPNARDSHGQSPLHLAAESDYPEVVKLFLKMKPDLSTLTATDENGYTCAHIAAMKGSVAVVRELMMIDKDMVLNAATKTSESTALHLAAGGGHQNVCQILINAGANPSTENMNGMTALHLAAKYGHTNILDVIPKNLWDYCSQKIGLTALHVAAHFGQIEFVRSMLSHLSATTRSEPPQHGNPLMVKELANDFALTPLHMAAQSGHEGLVRLLLNFQGVQVDAPTALQSIIALHLAAQCGHIAVVGLLLSRSTHQLHIKDSRGRTALHLAASNGHYDMCALLLGQGANINATDQNGWTALHFATKAGHTAVVKLLIESSGDPLAESKDGKVALTFAAAMNHQTSLAFLMLHDHDTYQLLEDRKFVFDLMICGKTHNFKPIEDFILLSPAPIDTAVKLSSIYRDMSTKEKERSKDLIMMCEYCEEMAADLMSIISSDYNAAQLLKSLDNRSRPFLDVLIENEQKKVVSHISVQQYLTEIWNGGITWGYWKFLLFWLFLFTFPPAWCVFSLPLDMKLCRAPIVRFICHLISHIYFLLILVCQVLALFRPIYESAKTPIPHWLELTLLLWLSGILVAELGNPAQRSVTRIISLICSAIAIMLHVAAFIYPNLIDPSSRQLCETLLYVRNQFLALATLLGCVQCLEYLTVHHLFGPWSIIISNLLYDLMRFLVVLMLFIAGFTILVAAIFKPAFEPTDASEVSLEDPLQVLDLLFFALFGLTDPDQMPPMSRTPAFSIAIMKSAFGVYMMVANVVLINLLIAMMSTTYERIEAQSDIEWKFGRAKLIRQMNKKSATAPPMNILTKFYTVLKVSSWNKCNVCSTQAQEAMRFEENIDSYSMTDGRGSPEFDERKIVFGDDSALLNAELGAGQKHINSVIDWKRVVESYRRFQGAEETPEDGLTGPPDKGGGGRMGEKVPDAKRNMKEYMSAPVDTSKIANGDVLSNY